MAAVWADYAAGEIRMTLQDVTSGTCPHSPAGRMLAPLSEERRLVMTARAELGPRGGVVVAAVWLIGLGVVFLVQQVLDLDWGEAWPLFIILVGVGTLASVVATVRPRGRWFVALAWPVLLVVTGVIFLLGTTGALGTDFGELVMRWWPIALVLVGGWFLIAAVLPMARVGTDRLAIPLGDASSAKVRLQFGGGELTVDAGTPDQLLVGEFENIGAAHRMLGPGSVELSPEGPPAWPWVDRPPRWRIALTTGVPVELDAQCGAAKVRMDLGAIVLRRLKISTGASDTRVQLPRAAGETAVRAEGGAASLTFEVPIGVAARIRSRMALGSTSVDEARFPKTGSGAWESADYGSATNRVDLDIQGGVGSVKVVGGV